MRPRCAQSRELRWTRSAFLWGGCISGTPHQRKLGILDDPDLLHRDWLSYARFGDGPEWDWPKRWARADCERNLEDVHGFLVARGIDFLPIVN
ncbi:MAG: hypothetical protein ACRBN8_09625 [Nannocystales bacterium]